MNSYFVIGLKLELIDFCCLLLLISSRCKCVQVLPLGGFYTCLKPSVFPWFQYFIFFKYCLTSTKASSFRCYHTKYIFRLTANYFLHCIPAIKSAGLLEKMLWLTSLIDLLIERSGTGLDGKQNFDHLSAVSWRKSFWSWSVVDNAENCFLDERVMPHAWWYLLCIICCKQVFSFSYFIF